LANFDYNDNGYVSKGEAASVTNLGTVFNGNSNITSFDEFQYFTGVTNLNPANSWNTGSFNDCVNLQKITLPSTMTVIHQGAFRGSKKLSEINLENVTEIQTAAFYNALNGVTINCPNLTSLSSNSVFANSGIAGVESLGNITTLESTGDSAGLFYNSTCAFLKLPKTLTNIGNHTLRNMGNLSSTVVIPASVTNIGVCAFALDNKVPAFCIERLTPPTLGAEAFIYTSCPIYVPDESVELYKATDGWADYANRIKPLSEYTE
jgi:hypothetical protein